MIEEKVWKLFARRRVSVPNWEKKFTAPLSCSLRGTTVLPQASSPIMDPSRTPLTASSQFIQAGKPTFYLAYHQQVLIILL